MRSQNEPLNNTQTKRLKSHAKTIHLRHSQRDDSYLFDTKSNCVRKKKCTNSCIFSLLKKKIVCFWNVPIFMFIFELLQIHRKCWWKPFQHQLCSFFRSFYVEFWILFLHWNWSSINSSFCEHYQFQSEELRWWRLTFIRIETVRYHSMWNEWILKKLHHFFVFEDMKWFEKSFLLSVEMFVPKFSLCVSKSKLKKLRS